MAPISKQCSICGVAINKRTLCSKCQKNKERKTKTVLKKRQFQKSTFKQSMVAYFKLSKLTKESRLIDFIDFLDKSNMYAKERRSFNAVFKAKKEILENNQGCNSFEFDSFDDMINEEQPQNALEDTEEEEQQQEQEYEDEDQEQVEKEDSNRDKNEKEDDLADESPVVKQKKQTKAVAAAKKGKKKAAAKKPVKKRVYKKKQKKVKDKNKVAAEEKEEEEEEEEDMDVEETVVFDEDDTMAYNPKTFVSEDPSSVYDYGNHEYEGPIATPMSSESIF